MYQLLIILYVVLVCSSIFSVYWSIRTYLTIRRLGKSEECNNEKMQDLSS